MATSHTSQPTQQPTSKPTKIQVISQIHHSVPTADEILTSSHITSHHAPHIGFSAIPKQTKYFKEAVPVEDFGPPLLIRETISNHKHLRQRLRDLERINFNNDQIVLFFSGTPDKNGRSWHADSNLVEKAVNFMLKKLQIGGFFLKIHVGTRSEWLALDNVYRKDPKIELIDIPTLWVWGSSKKITGKRCFDLESIYLLLKD